MKKLFSLILMLLIVFLSGINLSTNVFAEDLQNNLNFNEHFCFEIYSQNHFYCINKTTNKLVKYVNGEITEYGELGDADGKFSNIIFFKKLKNGEFVVLDNLNRLQFFDENFNHLKTIRNIYNNGFIPINSQNISDLSTDIYSNVYLLDATNNLLLKANSSQDNFTVINNYSNLTNSKLAVLNSNNNFVILKENSLILNNNSLTISNDCYEIFTDALNFIYIVQNNEILKYNTNLQLIDSFTHTKGSEYNLNLTNGTLYYILNNQIVTLENFASNISNYAPPIDVTENKTNNLKVEICNVTKNCDLLINPYSSESEIKVYPEDNIIKLAKTNNLQIEFAYVMIVKNNVTYLGYIENQNLKNKELNTLNLNVTPIRQNIKFYKYPNKFNYLTDNNLIYNEYYTVTREIIIDNINYYELYLNNSYVYCLKNELLNSELNYINTYLQTNAKLCLYNNETEINIYNNENKENVILTLTKNTNVKILNKNSNVTKIQLIKDNQIITGYVETRFVKFQSNYIIPLTIILSLISVVVLLILIYKFKKELTKRKGIK